MNKGKAKIKTLPIVIFFATGLFLLASCESKRIVYTPKGYIIDKPEIYDLSPKLDEISGICWINDTTMYANNDESGKIFAINLTNINDPDYANVKFGCKGCEIKSKDDYEDITKVGDAIYVLISTGKIIKVTNYRSEDSLQAEVVAQLPGNENEFESLYYDKAVHSLILLCKNCHKEKDKIRSAYRFDLESNTLVDTPYYQLSMDEVRMKVNDRTQEFRPSAAAINPIDGKLYMVSSIGKLLVIADRKGKVENAFHISAVNFAQPEGITFADNGDMYISNEVATEQNATLLKFAYTDPATVKK
ncbi:MAG TPA: SdiA-regulated domain-containing protein [Chitinophagaceae bacterium]|jgi:hypothetical protein|nr:SdiA-regulated domain-containing protein [Chitinophagaceae bacterium]